MKRSWYQKFWLKKFFAEKKAGPQKFRKKKNEKWPIFRDRPGYGPNILGANFYVLERSSVSILDDLTIK